MKIGFVIYGSLDTISGGYLYDRKLVAFLRAAGDEVTIISQADGTYREKMRQNDSAETLHQLTTAPFDVLIQDELNHPSLFRLNHKLRKQVDYPIVSIVHHLLCNEKRSAVMNFAYRQVESAYLNSVDGFIFNSQTTKESVLPLLSAPKPHVVALPSGDRFNMGRLNGAVKRVSAETDPLKVLFVGNIIARKGLHILLDSLDLLPAKNWELDVVGSSDIESAYAREIIDRLDAPNITFHGALSNNRLAFCYAAADVLAVPSSYEGYGIVYMEGMGFGLPAIATNSGAAQEMIKSGTNGYLIRPGDAADLAHYLRRLYGNRRLLRAMSLAASNSFHTHPSWQDSLSTIRRFLLKICAAD